MVISSRAVHAIQEFGEAPRPGERRQFRLEDKLEAMRTKVMNDVQICCTGTAAELYAMFRTQMNGSGVKHWEERAHHPVKGLLSNYVVGLDQAPDNKGCARRMQTFLKPLQNLLQMFQIF